MSRNPDIQRLLANLRSGGLLSDTEPQTSRPQHSLEVSAHHFSFLPQNNGTGDATSASAPPPRDVVIDPRPNTPQARVPLQEGRQQERITTNTAPDASSITTWPSAVKFVTKHIAPDAKLEARIKHLITEQHKHEREWWNKREVIIRRHTGRSDNQQRAADLLRSLGGQYVPVAPTDPQVDSAELEAYDLKVHKSLTQMAAHYDRELRQMGIPFFAVKHSFVISEAANEKSDTVKGRLGRGELKELQRRMIVHLEELFGDENEVP